MKNMPVARKPAVSSILRIFAILTVSLVVMALVFLVYVLNYSALDAYRYLLALYTPTRLLYALSFPLLFSVAVVFRRQQGYQHLHGSARWATYQEVSWKGFFKDKSGFILGALKGNIMTSWFNTHVILVAPTRSGKSVTTGVTTALENKENMFVLDIKGELYEKTYLWRKWFLKQKIILLDPAHPKSQKFNPLSLISIDGNTTLADIGRIAVVLYPPMGGDGQMWQELAKNLFTYSTYYLVLKNAGEKLPPPTLADVNNLWSQGIEDIAEKIESDCKRNPIISTIDSDGQIINEISQFSSTTERARSSILTTFLAPLKIFIEPQVKEFTASTTLQFSEFIYQPATIYFSVKPNDLNRLAPLINIFLELLLNQLARATDENRRTIFFLLDEFTSIGKVQTITKALAYLASYKIRFCFIVQNLAQLKHLYGDEMEVILSNCYVKIFSAVSEPTTQRYIMDLLGNETLIVRRPQGRSEEIKRPLLTTDEIGTLPGILNKRGKPHPGKLIMVIDNMHPVLCERVLYFMMLYFRNKIFV